MRKMAEYNQVRGSQVNWAGLSILGWTDWLNLPAELLKRKLATKRN